MNLRAASFLIVCAITLFALIVALRDSRDSVDGAGLQETYTPEELKDLFNPPTTVELERSIAERRN
ncbi:MAG: hypothetical protein OXC63_00115, partial [Aestuariivita sp.]|nr:hypothetical protein [Aestuariivita sp.]